MSDYRFLQERHEKNIKQKSGTSGTEKRPGCNITRGRLPAPQDPRSMRYCAEKRIRLSFGHDQLALHAVKGGEHTLAVCDVGGGLVQIARVLFA